MTAKLFIAIVVVISASALEAQTRLIVAFEAIKNPDQQQAHEASSRFLREIVPDLAYLDKSSDRDADIEYLVAQFSNPSNYIREQAAAVLDTAEMLCPGLNIDQRFFPTIYKLLQDPEPRTRENAIRMLAFAKEPKPHLESTDVSRVLDLLNDEAKRVRQTASTVALYEQPLRETTLIAVISRLDKDPDLQAGILAAIGEIPVTSRPAVDLLIECLNSESQRNQGEAMTVLGKLGIAAEPAIPALRKLLGSPNEATREGAANTLKTLGR